MDRKSREGVMKGERRQRDRMGGTGVDMGWNGKGRERENRKGTEMPEERDYSPQTSIPGAATDHKEVGQL